MVVTYFSVILKDFESLFLIPSFIVEVFIVMDSDVDRITTTYIRY